MEEALGTRDGWSIEPDPEGKDGQTLLFHYPRVLTRKAMDVDTGYIRPRIKLQYGARGEPEPYGTRSITPYLAGEFPDAQTEVETLSIERSFRENVTILHALHHNERLRDGMSRHYYDVVMLAAAGIGARRPGPA